MNRIYRLLIILYSVYLFFGGTVFYRGINATYSAGMIMVLIVLYLIMLLSLIRCILLYVNIMCREEWEHAKKKEWENFYLKTEIEVLVDQNKKFTERENELRKQIYKLMEDNR